MLTNKQLYTLCAIAAVEVGVAVYFTLIAGINIRVLVKDLA